MNWAIDCPKCGTSDTMIVYCFGETPASVSPKRCRMKGPHEEDRFHRLCGACEYQWLDLVTIPLDARGGAVAS